MSWIMSGHLRTLNAGEVDEQFVGRELECAHRDANLCGARSCPCSFLERQSGIRAKCVNFGEHDLWRRATLCAFGATLRRVKEGFERGTTRLSTKCLRVLRRRARAHDRDRLLLATGSDKALRIDHDLLRCQRPTRGLCRVIGVNQREIRGLRRRVHTLHFECRKICLHREKTRHDRLGCLREIQIDDLLQDVLCWRKITLGHEFRCLVKRGVKVVFRRMGTREPHGSSDAPDSGDEQWNLPKIAQHTHARSRRSRRGRDGCRDGCRNRCRNR